MTDGQFERHCVRMLVEPRSTHPGTNMDSPEGWHHCATSTSGNGAYGARGWTPGEAEAAYCSEVIAEWMSNSRRTAPESSCIDPACEAPVSGFDHGGAAAGNRSSQGVLCNVASASSSAARGLRSGPRCRHHSPPRTLHVYSTLRVSMVT